MKTRIRTDELMQPIATFSHATQAGGVIHLGATAGTDSQRRLAGVRPGLCDVEIQIEKMLANVDFVLSKYPNITNSLSIHIRRGDYVGQPNHHPVVPVSYYEKILNEISQDYNSIFVFSDDINWVKENFKGDKFIFPQFESNDDLNSFVLMTLAKDNVIGNSTYSWWAAWLNKNQNKKVYSPHYKQWFGTSYSNLDTKDLIPVNWIQTEY